jgi:hypothetical protein
MLHRITTSTNISDPDIESGVGKNVGKCFIGHVDDPREARVGESMHKEDSGSSAVGGCLRMEK